MKTISMLPVLSLSLLFLSCGGRKEVKDESIEVRDVVMTELVIEEPPAPPPPGLRSEFGSVEEWLSHLCKNESPDSSIRYFSFGVFESAGRFTLFMTGSKQGRNVDTVTIDFEPSGMYYLLPQSATTGQDYRRFCDSISAKLKAFTRTEKFRRSFFGRAEAVFTEFDGKDLLKEK